MEHLYPTTYQADIMGSAMSHHPGWGYRESHRGIGCAAMGGGHSQPLTLPHASNLNAWNKGKTFFAAMY